MFDDPKYQEGESKSMKSQMPEEQKKPMATEKPISPQPQPVPDGQSAVMPAMMPVKSGGNVLKIVLLFVVAIVVIVGVVFGILWYTGRDARPVVMDNSDSFNSVDTSVGDTTEVIDNFGLSNEGAEDGLLKKEDIESNPSNSITEPSSNPQELLGDQSIDSDGDGLMDGEEAVYNTNPLKADTDSDGLDDFQEVRVYNTDPLNRDSDNDTYLDGDEVKNGYDPNGPGKLLNL
ncbi:hypothetical protein COT97_02080 [Candidatus Falkowbacteria bacterium CG10_big_fil_rev_8_21_14_0_10_39_11]|uniref:Uncharacterized protein n=1 Tax=Candidatus Falkowbacteria bacterium CG10_big_fil_rev_8_21_14_0_10_39_11 TaxID=1974565 RepID=A0A2H0V5A9_9BACT|nr:MAG: hypothetical protein COT97_02080 [Candidatus Falkowbacteria bacterium CG10_big_fil_rev_8_21_14_0_10_39_11]